MHIGVHSPTHLVVPNPMTALSEGLFFAHVVLLVDHGLLCVDR